MPNCTSHVAQVPYKLCSQGDQGPLPWLAWICLEGRVNTYLSNDIWWLVTLLEKKSELQTLLSLRQSAFMPSYASSAFLQTAQPFLVLALSSGLEGKQHKPERKGYSAYICVLIMAAPCWQSWLPGPADEGPGFTNLQTSTDIQRAELTGFKSRLPISFRQKAAQCTDSVKERKRSVVK